MYARVANIIAQNELQLTMWIETFKAISAKPMSEFGSIQITITNQKSSFKNSLLK